MPELFFKCLFAVLAVLGGAETVRAAVAQIFRKNCPARHYLMFSVSGHDEQAEQRLRSACLRAEWIGFGTQVVCLDRGMDGETRRICELVCADHPEIICCTPEDFEKFWMA